MSPFRNLLVVVAAICHPTITAGQSPKSAAVKPIIEPEWRMFGGDPGRSAQGKGGAPALPCKWNYPTIFTDKGDFSDTAKDWIERAVKR
jgi:hypothetical protein